MYDMIPTNLEYADIFSLFLQVIFISHMLPETTRLFIDASPTMERWIALQEEATQKYL